MAEPSATHFAASVARVQRVGTSLTRLWLDVPTNVLKAFQAAGQYHHLSVHQGDESPFAIASRPGEPHFEYLIRDGGSVADALAATKPGDAVHVTQPTGTGFALERGHGHDVALIGTGTGFAPLRGALGVVLEHRSKFRRVTAVYGARSVDELVFANEFPAWEAAGISVWPSLTEPPSNWTGRVGRLQAHLETLQPHDGPVLVCGQRGLIDDVRARFPLVLTNV